MKNKIKKTLLIFGSLSLLTGAAFASYQHRISSETVVADDVVTTKAIPATNTFNPPLDAKNEDETNSTRHESPHSNRSANNNSLEKDSSPGTIITTNNPNEVQEYAKQHNLTISAITPITKNEAIVALIESPDHPSISAIKQMKSINSISLNNTYRATYTFSNPDTNYTSQWNLAKISAPQAWDISTGSSQTVIAVLDTGVLSSQKIGDTTYQQPDFPSSKMWINSGESGPTTGEGLAPNCTSRGLPLDKKCNNLDDDNNGQIDDWRGWDFMGGFNGSSNLCPNYQAGRLADVFIAEDNDPQPYSCDSPYHPSELNKTHYNGTCDFGYSACYIGHGTMVASAASSASNNGTLIAGVDHDATIMDLRVLDGYGYTTTDRVAAAVRYAAKNGADVINMSLAVSDCSGSFSDPVLESAMAAAHAAGATIVAASGNEYLSTVCYPASSKYSIAVGASDQNDARANFSNYGSKLDIVAPGVSIPVANAPSNAINNQYYPSANGTSLAAPHVAGLAGLLKAVRPNASPDHIRQLIVERADPTSQMNGSVFTTQYGYGRINAYTSVKVAQGIERPIYKLLNAATNCTLLTSSIPERNVANLKRGYQYQVINSWEVRDKSGTHEPHTTNSQCR